MIFLDQVPGLHRLRTVSSVGEVFPLTTTANGRACLALMPDNQARDLIEQELAESGSDAKIKVLQGKLEDIRTSGLAYDIDEHTLGISAIGFAFRDLGANFHAISVPVPSLRYTQVKDRLEHVLKKARTQIMNEFSAN
jgi:DNA-binding IclR family transcriptional regulator